MSQMVSIIIPAYNHSAALPATLEAIFTQSYVPLEVIVVNDGSTDETAAFLQAYADRIQVIHQPNAGAQQARNRGFAESHGEYVIFCDADVVMQPTMIELMVRALDEHPEASYAYSSFKFGWKKFREVSFSAAKLKTMNFIHTSSLIRREDFPGFDESIKRFQDWDLWLTMLKRGKLGVLVPGTLFSVAIHGSSRIGSSWLPSFLYRIPWKVIGWRPRKIALYEVAKEIIKTKHRL